MIFKGRLNNICTIISVIIVIIIIIFNYIDITMLKLPQGEFITSEQSFNKEYTLNAYLVSYKEKDETGIRVEVVNNKTKKSKTIYWEYPNKDIKMLWIDETHVDINDIILNIKKNTYKSINMNYQ